MRAVVQRVTRAGVSVGGSQVAAIGPGLMILVGVGKGDSEQDACWLADKTAQLRIFPDEDGNMNRSLVEVGGEALVVSQFTLYGDCRKGRRPSWHQAALPEQAEGLYQEYCRRLAQWQIPVKQGVFGAMMQVEIHNDGPVTLLLDSKREF